MKKRLSLLLTVILAMTIFSSCAAEAPQLLQFIDANEESVVDLKGKTIYIGLREGGSIIPDPEDNTLEADEQRAKIRQVESKLNCIVAQGVQEDENLIAAAVVSESSKYDLYYGASYDHFDWYIAGILYDYRNVESIDLSDAKKWGTPQEQLPRTFKGAVFGVLPTSITVSSTEGVILVNDSLIKSFAQPTPKELKEQGNWTFDYFKDYVVAVSDMGAENPIYGMTTYPNQQFQIPLTAIFANGSSLLSFSDNGEVKFNVTADRKALTAIEWAKEVFDTGVVANDPNTAEHFTNGRSSMWIGGVWVGVSTGSGLPLSEMTEGFTFIEFPYGPDAEYGKTYSAYSIATMSYAMPITAASDEMGAFLNEFCGSSLTEDELNAKKADYREQFFHDPDDYELLKNMSENIVYTYFTTELSNVEQSFCDTLINICKGQINISEGLASIAPRIQAELDNFN